MAKQTSSRKRLLWVLLLAGIIPFAFPFGRPMLNWNDINPHALKQIFSTNKNSSETASLSLHNSQLDKAVTVYRWRDENGGWSFGSIPPENGISYSPITIQSDANIIQGLPQDTAKEKDESTIVLPGEDGEPLTMMGYSAEDVSKIMQSAKEARAAMEQRYKEEQAVFNSLQ